MKHCPTMTATIYVGLRVGYSNQVNTIYAVHQICQEYVNEVGLGLTVTPTHFIYVDGEEAGAIIGLTNHPMFPSSEVQIRMHALALGWRLLEKLKQERLTIVFDDDTVMLEKEEVIPNGQR